MRVLSKAPDEGRPARPSRPLQDFGSSVKCSLRAETLYDAQCRQSEVEDFARSRGFKVQVGAVGVGLNGEAA